MKKGAKQTGWRSLLPASTMISTLMLFAVMGVMAPAAVIAPVPSSLTFTATYSDTNAIPTQTFDLIVPSDVSATEYVLATTNCWIVSVKNADGDVSGTVPAGGTNTITVTVVATNLLVGDYIGTITVGADWSDVTVALRVMTVAVVADFDGDGLADPAVYNTNGNWKIKLSGSGYALVPLTGFLGGSGYTALAADFDGDGVADPTIYNAELELWAIKLSSLSYLTPTVLTSFGGSGWAALAGDFDGDGLADPALYQASTGTWKAKLSTANYVTLISSGLVGETGWTAIAADFDGDGKVDPTIYQASTGTWVVLMSKVNYAVAVIDPDFLGATGYTGMAADFDGDGYADPTAAETSTGNWKVKLSSSNYGLLDLPGFLGE